MPKLSRFNRIRAVQRKAARDLIRETLVLHKNNKTAAALALGITRQGLDKMLA